MGRQKKKRKGKIRIKTGTRVVKKDSVKKNALPKTQGRPPATTAPVIRVKLKKKQ